MQPGDFPLVVGDPGRTSYSRFVLPLPYRLERWSGSEGPFQFVRAGDDDWLHAPTFKSMDRGRRDFLTRETREILHEGAQWLVLRGEAGGESGPAKTPVVVDWSAPKRTFEFLFHSPTGRQVPVHLRAPALVLFEQPDGLAASEGEDGDPLHLCFLVWEAFFGGTAPEQPQATLADLLEFNELFRYWQHHFRPAAWASALADLPVDFGKPGTRIADKLVRDNPLYPGGEVPPGLVFDRWAWLLDCPVAIGGRKYSFVPAEQREQAHAWSRHEQGSKTGSDPGWLLHADNRTFVWTCALSTDQQVTEMSKLADGCEADLPAGLGAWVKLLNVDGTGGPSASLDAATEFDRHWAGRRTYRRWAAGGTLYGYCNHAGALLGQQQRLEVGKYWGEHYFDQLLLLLYVRTALFGFSWRLAQISAKVRRAGGPGNSDGWRDFREGFEKLRVQFALFANLYQFPLISNQQQGVELYSLLRRSLDVEDLFREIQTEIQQSDDLFALHQQRRQGDLTLYLTVVGTGGVVLGLALGAVSNGALMDHLKDDSDRIPAGWTFFWFLAALTAAAAAVGVLLKNARWLGDRMRGLAERPGRDWWRSSDE